MRGAEGSACGAAASPGAGPAGRVVSVDALRGLVVLAMIFVEQAGPLKAAPAWVKHMWPPDADGMTFADLIFPMFLFLVGMSIPVSLARRRARGEPTRRAVGHGLTRAAGLVVMGVFMANAEEGTAAGGWPRGLWGVLALAALAAAWSDLPAGGRAVRLAGLAALVWLALVFRGPNGLGFRVPWWGILGLIGWAYLVAGGCVLVFGRDRAGLVGSVALLQSVYLADRHGLFPGSGAGWSNVGEVLGALPSIAVAGAALGAGLVRRPTARVVRRQIRWALGFGLGLGAAAVLLYPTYGVNKIAATPSWCLGSSAIACWAWALVCWVVDMRGWTGWYRVVRPAAEAPLAAYLLQSALPACVALAGLPSVAELAGSSVLAGGLACAGLALAVSWLAGGLADRGVRIRL